MNVNDERVLGRSLAVELTEEEIAEVSGAGAYSWTHCSMEECRVDDGWPGK